MSAESFTSRLPYNTPGKFYVDEKCLDCDLCRETAPMIFSRNVQEATSYIIKQPETEEELKLAQEAMDCCPCVAIFDDGDQHDWSKAPLTKRPSWRTGNGKKPTCSQCQKKSNPWWKFWT